MVLDPKRRQTKLWGQANVESQSIGGSIGSAPKGAAPIGGTTDRIVVDIDTTFHDVLDCVADVHAVWTRLMTENAW